jgi:hypothetical protein
MCAVLSTPTRNNGVPGTPGSLTERLRVKSGFAADTNSDAAHLHHFLILAAAWSGLNMSGVKAIL